MIENPHTTQNISQVGKKNYIKWHVGHGRSGDKVKSGIGCAIAELSTHRYQVLTAFQNASQDIFETTIFSYPIFFL